MCLCLSKTANRITHAVQKKLKANTNTAKSTTATTTTADATDTFATEFKSKKWRHNRVTVN